MEIEKYAGIASVVLILMVVLVYGLFTWSSTIPMNMNSTVMNTTEVTLNKGVQFASIDRARYKVPNAIFADLPMPPAEFSSYTIAVTSGTLTDMCAINEDVYMQPEFYPNFDVDPLNRSDFGVGVKMLQNHDVTRWGVIGYGAYPSDAYVSTSNGSEFTSCVFFHTSWDVETWQGIGFFPIYPNASYDQFGALIAMQNDSVKDYITATITPNQAILSPVFPKFNSNWSYKLQFKVNVAEGTPSGIYVVALGLGKPKETQNQAWAAEHLARYTSSGGRYGMDRPLYRIIIEVK